MNPKKILTTTCILLAFTASLIAQDSIMEKKPKKVTFHGDLGLSLNAYGVNGIPARQKPFFYVFSANATLNLGGFEIPFNLDLSDLQRSYAQPFNQFGFAGNYNGASPKWKWIKIHAGYRNVTFSEFTLAGHTFLGGGIELTPGIFRFGFIYGRFNKETTSNSESISDTLPSYKRMGYAVKIGLGSEKNFFDLLFLRVRDDSTSLKQPDSITQQFPEQNIVAGFNSRFTIAKRLTWETEAAISLFTNNLGSEEILDSSSNPTLYKMNDYLAVNLSSEYQTAVKSFLQYKAKSWSVRLQYRRIDPQFKSMGAYYFSSDLENITLSPSLILFKRKVMLSGSIGLQRDNLRNLKKATSTHTIGNVNLSINPSAKFGLDASYSNYSMNQKAGTSPIIDSIRMHQSNHNLSIMPRLMFANEKKSHMIMLAYNFGMLDDKNENTADNNYFDSHIAQLTYTLGLVETGWSFTFGLSYMNFYTYLLTTNESGGTFGLSKSFLNSKLSINWNNSLIRSASGDEKGWIVNSNPSANYQINGHNSARLNIFFTGNYTGQGSISPSFNECKGELSYVFTF